MEYDGTYAESSVGGQSFIVNLLCHENWGSVGEGEDPKTGWWAVVTEERKAEKSRRHQPIADVVSHVYACQGLTHQLD